jgi:hypothetical protein
MGVVHRHWQQFHIFKKVLETIKGAIEYYHSHSQ